ncbi:hypothetical protein, conserved [Leishmania tarentolae]|uniref:Uncharacterized protein n=1 Tax=Leishmania tarentolae TaxID=5689 RepID=A0A640KTB6_LEITA|nr:hypothetical protein, conserved [Leishmania tarentolae]
MQLGPLRKLVVLFDTQLQQLTVSYLAAGFFALHTAAISIASLVVCASLALANASGSGRSNALLFTSFTSFASLSVLTLMMLTLLYRVIGGRFLYSSRETEYVVDWILDTVSRPVVHDTVHLLLSPNKRRGRGIFFISLCLLGEAGKFLSFWPICTLASMVWCSWSIRRAWRQNFCAD